MAYYFEELVLYGFCLIQIFIYLFFVPVIRIVVGDISDGYSWWFASIFLLAFLLGGVWPRPNYSKSLPARWELNQVGAGLIVVWALVYVGISSSYGLYNRRIGTHEAAELFASMPVYVLVLIRSLEVMLPYLFSIFLVKFAFKVHASRRDRIVLAAVILVALFSGVLYSRSQIFFLLLTILVLIQNIVDRSFLKRVLFYGGSAAVLFAVGVTVYRLIGFDGEFDNQYLSREFLARLDGLEFVSMIMDDRDVSWFGVNADALFSSLIAAVPFLPEATELKAAAMTSIKANILFYELGSSQGDINSFVSLDPYYWGGLAGLFAVGGLLGWISRWVDCCIGTGRSRAMDSLMIAAACNLVFMERESVTIVVGVLRDWMIIYLFTLAFVNMDFFDDSADNLRRLKS